MVVKLNKTNPQLLRLMIFLRRKKSSFSQLERLFPAILGWLAESNCTLTEMPA
jgi:hypothetical protein